MRRLSIRTMGLVMTLLVGLSVMGVSIAAAAGWLHTDMTGKGTIEVVAAPTYSYTVTGTALDFGTKTIDTDSGSFTMTATASVENTGSVAIGGLHISNIHIPSNDAGLNLTVSDTAVAIGATETVTFTLTGTAPSGVESIDLDGITFDLDPQS